MVRSNNQILNFQNHEIQTDDHPSIDFKASSTRSVNSNIHPSHRSLTDLSLLHKPSSRHPSLFVPTRFNTTIHLALGSQTIKRFTLHQTSIQNQKPLNWIQNLISNLITKLNLINQTSTVRISWNAADHLDLNLNFKPLTLNSVLTDSDQDSQLIIDIKPTYGSNITQVNLEIVVESLYFGFLPNTAIPLVLSMITLTISLIVIDFPLRLSDLIRTKTESVHWLSSNRSSELADEEDLLWLMYMSWCRGINRLTRDRCEVWWRCRPSFWSHTIVILMNAIFFRVWFQQPQNWLSPENAMQSVGRST